MRREDALDRLRHAFQIEARFLDDAPQLHALDLRQETKQFEADAFDAEEGKRKHASAEGKRIGIYRLLVQTIDGKCEDADQRFAIAVFVVRLALQCLDGQKAAVHKIGKQPYTGEEGRRTTRQSQRLPQGRHLDLLASP